MRLRFSQSILLVSLVLLFLIANRGAYEGYFSDDDLDNLAGTMLAGPETFWRSFGSLLLDEFNFRPVGHVVYRWMGQWWGLRFEAYVALVQVLHLFNSWLVYRLIEPKLGKRAGLIGATFFLFHPALIAAHWKPMYIFDILCASALSASLLFYRARRWLLSLFFFWCAYKAKEISIFFPLLLVVEEWLGKREWRMVAPFLCVSLNFGCQALMANRTRPSSAYTLRFDLPSLFTCARFYARWTWTLPWTLLIFWRWLAVAERRAVIYGAFAAIGLMAPILFLPGRLFAVYLYVPMLFASIAIAAVSIRVSRVWLVVVFLLYAFIGLSELRQFRRAELSQAHSNREYVTAACAALLSHRNIERAFYEGAPRGLNTWGVEGAIRLCQGNLMLQLSPWALAKIKPQDMVIRWKKMPGKLGEVEVSRFQGELGGDWYAWDESFRWMGAQATATSNISPADRHIEIDLVAAVANQVRVSLNGREIATQAITQRGAQRLVFRIPPNPTHGPSLISIAASPMQKVEGDPRELTLAVRSITVTR